MFPKSIHVAVITEGENKNAEKNVTMVTYDIITGSSEGRPSSVPTFRTGMPA